MLGALLVASLSFAASAAPDAVVRTDHFVGGEGGIRLFVREVRASEPATSKRTPILMLHGARVPGLGGVVWAWRRLVAPLQRRRVPAWRRAAGERRLQRR